jgi:hypothetical protein
MGNVCDSNGFCFVVDRVDACLDPSSVFAVYAGEPRVIRTGEKLPLLFWANRKNRALEYEWTIVDRPEKSTASTQLYLTVEGDPVTGCSTAGMGAVASLWFLLGFAWLCRRMSHRNDA